MIVKKVIDICKKSEVFKFYTTNEGQWLSDGAAIYPLFGIPHLCAGSVCTMYDISKSKKDKILFRHEVGLPQKFNFCDVVEEEKECIRIPISIVGYGGVLIPYQCSSGAVYFDSAYFEPLKDIDPNMLRVFERVTSSGSGYYVVKDGMCLVALIMPMRVTDEMVKQLDCLKKLTALALENSSARLSLSEGEDI